MQLSKTIIAKEAKSCGLIDDIASPNNLLNISRLWALEISEQNRPRISSLHRTDKLGSLSEVHKMLEATRILTKTISPNMPQHKACLDAIEEGINFGGYAGLLKVRIILYFIFLLLLVCNNLKVLVTLNNCVHKNVASIC